jgi:hypothetical protein
MRRKQNQNLRLVAATVPVQVLMVPLRPLLYLYLCPAGLRATVKRCCSCTARSVALVPYSITSYHPISLRYHLHPSLHLDVLSSVLPYATCSVIVLFCIVLYCTVLLICHVIKPSRHFIEFLYTTDHHSLGCILFLVHLETVSKGNR